MAGQFESSGDIEILCRPSGIGVGDRVSILFIPSDSASPPFTLKVFSPSGANVLDTLVRAAPTGEPQSPPPVEFIVSALGQYRIEVKELRGRQRGEATLKVG